MQVFVTGATGFVGAAVVRELIGNGHQVLGLARNDAAAAALSAAGAQVHRGDLEDLDSLRRGAAASDGVIHAGFIHDFQNFKACCEVDRQAIGALGDALAGTERPLLVTSGTLMIAPGQPADELTPRVGSSAELPRMATSEAFEEVLQRGVRAAQVRLSPSVHGDGDHGFVPMLINLARSKGKAAYVGAGANRWTGVHRFDAARLYRLALENCVAGRQYHAVDEVVSFREIAEAIGAGLDLPAVSLTPQEAGDYFSWMTHFAQIDGPVSSQLTRQWLGWQPVEPGLIADLAQSQHYFRL